MQSLIKTFAAAKLIRRETGRIPTAAASLGLGIASLGWTLEHAAPLGGAGQTAGAVLSSLLLACVAGKFILHPLLMSKEIRHPVTCSILPTFAMSLMVISKALGMYYPAAAGTIWVFAVSLHILIFSMFVWHHIIKCDLAAMVPSWFVPPVGIITAAVTVPGSSFVPFAEIVLLFGLTCFAVILPVMVYRLLFHPAIADAAKPTIAVLAAPASLSLVGYLSVEQQPSLIVIALLLGIALLMTLSIYLALFRLLRLPFSPAYAAFTFPLVISATALYKVTDIFAANPATAHHAQILYRMATLELVVAVGIVGYVCWLYALAGGKAVRAQTK